MGVLGGPPEELFPIVGDEVAAVPVALKHGTDLRHDARVPRPRDADVPLKAADLRRVGEVRRADVRGSEAGMPMKEPRFRMEARRRDVVGDPNLHPGGDERIERLHLRGAGVGRRQHAGDPPFAAMKAQRIEHRLDAGTPNEGHHHIDAIGRVDLRQNLIPNTRFPGGIRQERRIEERNQRSPDRLRAPIGEQGEHAPKHLRRGHRPLRPKRLRRGRRHDLIDQRRREGRPNGDAIGGGERSDGALKDRRDMKRKPVGRFRLMKGRPRNRTPRNPSGKSFGNQGFVETGLGH